MKLQNVQDDNANKANALYLLHHKMEVKIGEDNTFFVKKTFKQNAPLCACGKKAKGEFAVFPCLHLVCADCGKGNGKECPQCKKAVSNKVRLIDIYEDVM